MARTGLSITGRVWPLIASMMVIVALILGALTGCAVPILSNASSNASLKMCQANQRTVLGIGATYEAANPGTTLPETFDGWMSVLVPAMIKKVPVCPDSGTYSFATAGDPSSLTCSVHGGLD